jgi:hypothetical protein
MSTNPQSISRPVASLSLPTTVLALIAYAQGIVKALTGNASLPNPIPTVAALTAAIDDLAAAQTAALTRIKGAVTTRNERRAALLGLLRQLRGNVQAAADANPDSGGTIIESAGIALKKPQTRPARVFAAAPSGLSGSVKLVAPSAAARSSYEWEYSTDGGATWVTAPPSLQAKTVVPGMKTGTVVQFRYRSVVKGGAANWSPPVSLLVP